MSFYQKYSTNKFTRDSIHKKVSGLCAGIARQYKVPRIAVRAAAIISFLYFPVAIGAAYVVASLLTPTRSF